MNFVLDTTLVGHLCHPNREVSKPIVRWLADLLDDEGEEHRVFLPEIADYELRRKLLHLVRTRREGETSLERLDVLGKELDYLPIRTETLRRAAVLWAEARSTGTSTAPPAALDGDVILAAQAQEVSGVVITENRKHLARYVTVSAWQDVK